ncbi:MAG: chromate transporter, partial [Phenylobacterium sp.]
MPNAPAPPKLRDLVQAFARIGVLGFGGPAGQIALMHREIVEERRWIDEEQFLAGLNFCHLLPGPEAQQLATWIGWRLHGWRGGLVAGSLFVLPGAAVMLGLSVLYVLAADLAWLQAVFLGIKAAVVALVLQALARIAGRTLKTRALQALAGVAFLAIFLLDLPFPAVVLAAALAGAVLA